MARKKDYWGLVAIFGILGFVAIYSIIQDLNRISRQEFFSAIGLLGEHELGRLERGSGIDGSLEGEISGGFFFVSGYVQGDVRTKEMLQFSWSPNDSTVIETTIPTNMIIFKIDPARDVPTARFVFSQSYLGVTFHPASISETDLLGYNDHISKGLAVVEVRISQETYDCHDCLPARF